MKITLSGDKALDARLLALAREDGPKSINAAMRKATRIACRTVLLPEVKALVPVDTGFLEDEIKVRAIKRNSRKVGHYVGFADPLFQGDTFYGGFLEFGFRRGKRLSAGARRAGGDTRSKVEADSFLRRPLYGNEERIKQIPRAHLSAMIAGANGAVPDRP
ncbi:MAG: HK97 gp10 family phage protein [Lacipirellulaceae bacterium]